MTIQWIVAIESIEQKVILVFNKWIEDWTQCNFAMGQNVGHWICVHFKTISIFLQTDSFALIFTVFFTFIAFDVLDLLKTFILFVYIWFWNFAGKHF